METSENSSASTELTSTQGSVLTTDANDATQNLVGDSVPSSSSDANLPSNISKTIQDDPISSTSDSVSTFNFTEEKDTSKDLVSDSDFFSSELNIGSITTEKISEDVEDIANDLENLLGETNNDFIIPLSLNRDDSVCRKNDAETSVLKENKDSESIKPNPISDDSCNIADKVDSTETVCAENREVISITDTQADNVIDIDLVTTQNSIEEIPETSSNDSTIDSKVHEHQTLIKQNGTELIKNQELDSPHAGNDAPDLNVSVEIDHSSNDDTTETVKKDSISEPKPQDAESSVLQLNIDINTIDDSVSENKNIEVCHTESETTSKSNQSVQEIIPQIEAIPTESEIKEQIEESSPVVDSCKQINENPIVNTEKVQEIDSIDSSSRCPETRNELKETQKENTDLNKNPQDTFDKQTKIDNIDKKESDDDSNKLESSECIVDVPDGVNVSKDSKEDRALHEKQTEVQTLPTTEPEVIKINEEIENVDSVTDKIDNPQTDHESNEVNTPDLVDEKTTSADAKDTNDVALSEEATYVPPIESQESPSITAVVDHSVTIAEMTDAELQIVDDQKSKLDDVSALVEEHPSNPEVIEEETENNPSVSPPLNENQPETEQSKSENREVELNNVSPDEVKIDKTAIEKEEDGLQLNEVVTSVQIELSDNNLHKPENDDVRDEVKLPVTPTCEIQGEKLTQSLEEHQEVVKTEEDVSQKTSINLEVTIESSNNDTCDANDDEKEKGKVEMTISSIIEEAIQDENQSLDNDVISEIAANPTEELIENVSNGSVLETVVNDQVEEQRKESDQHLESGKSDVKESITQKDNVDEVLPNVLSDSDQTENIVPSSSDVVGLHSENQQESDQIQDVIPTSSDIAVVPQTEIQQESDQIKDISTSSDVAVLHIESQQEEVKELSNAHNEVVELQKTSDNQSVTNESDNEKVKDECEDIQEKTEPQSDAENIKKADEVQVNLVEQFENVSEKSPETLSENLEFVDKECTPTDKESDVISPISEALVVIPDSLDEGNIAALAICEPSSSDYYHIDDDTVNDQVIPENKTPIQNIDQVTAEETDPLPELQSETKPIDESSKEVVDVEIHVSNPSPPKFSKETSKEENDCNNEVLIKQQSDKLTERIVSEAKDGVITAANNETGKGKMEIIITKVLVGENTTVPSLKPEKSSEIQPLIIDVDNPIEINEDSESLTPQYSSKMSTKELLKMTITKHKIDSPKEDDSILKIYDPKEEKDSKKNPKVKDSIPKLIIKPVVRSQSPPLKSDEPEQAIPKLLIRNMSPNRPCSPKVSKVQKSESSTSLKVTIKSIVKADENQSKSSPKLNIKPVVKNDEDTFTPKITIKPIIKPEEEVTHSPKITIKPIVKPEEETSSSPRITIKPILKPEEHIIEPSNPRITIKPLVKPDEDVLKEEERSHSPRITIKPIKSDDSKVSGEEMVHSPRITIKPIKPPDEEEASPKITIKAIIKPQEEDRQEKKEGSPKIKIKPIPKPSEESPELIDFEEQIKQERIVLKINTKESRKREATEEIEKLAKIKLKFSKEGGHAHIVSDQKLKRALEQPHDMDNKRTKIETVDLSISPDCKEIIEIKDDSNPPFEDPIESIPTFQINTQTVAVQNNPPPVTVTPAPRKRGRPRKIPLVVREEFKDPKEEEPEPIPIVEDTGRPKRSCRGPSVCTTLGIKPRKPRGGGAAGTRGRGRGRGSRGGSRGSNRQQRVSARSKLLEEEVVADTSVVGRPLVDEIIEIPDDDPKEEEHPPQPLPQTQPEVIEVRASTSSPVVGESVAAESATESVAEKVPSEIGSDVVLIEEETRMSGEIHNSRAQTPAKQVLAVVDIEDTQSSVQSTATTESVKVVRKGSRLEVHHEPDDIISPEQLAEYYWGGTGPYMLQEQVAQFLGIKSFKRKYPGIQRRPVDMQERDFIRESCLASEAMCDMGLTAVASADILDIMYSDFQHKYEEYCKHQRDRHTKDIINKQKALNLAASQEKSKHDLTQQAVQSAAAWNVTFNKTRREERRACMDLQTFTVNYPRGKFKNPEKPKVGSYPIALVPGQYTDCYKDYTPNELYNLPLNTMMNQTLSIIRDDDSQSEGSGSDSDTTTSDSDSTSSDSSDEDCNICNSQMNSRKVAAN